MKVPAEALGKKYRCVKCGETVTVTADNARTEGGAPPSAPAKPQAQPGAAAPNPERIGGMLVEAGLVTADQLGEALAHQQKHGGKTFEILVALGHLDKEQLHSFLSKQPGVAAIHLSRVSIDRELIGMVPKEMAVEHKVLPVDRLGKLLTVAMACPFDTVTIHEMEMLTGLKVKAMLCRLDDIEKAVQKYYPEKPANAPGVISFPGATAKPREELGQAIAQLQQLPVPDEMVDRIQTMVADAEASVRQLGDLAATDPACAAMVLQAANSPVYAMPGRVQSVALAAVLLDKAGLGAVAARSQGSAPALAGMSDRARRCAAAAAALSRATGSLDESVVRTAGVLHEMGRLVLRAAAPERFAEVDSTLTGTALAAEERKHFSHNHAEAGAALATQWRFPQPLVQALRCYLDPSQAGDDAALASMVALGAVAAVRGDALAPDDLEPCRPALEQVQMGPGDAVQVMRAAMAG